MMTCGTYAIANGAIAGAVTGLAISYEGTIPPGIFPVPKVLVRVRKPAGGLNIFASVVSHSESLDGFRFYLSGETDSANYKLDYLIFT
jgi:hypothetical protein